MGIKRRDLRRAVLERDGCTCVCCNLDLPEREAQLHHILPKRLNGPDCDFNLITLCHGCHTEWHKYEASEDIMWEPSLAVRVFYTWLVGGDSEHGEALAEEHREEMLAYYDGILNILMRQIPQTKWKPRKQPKFLGRVRRRN